MDIQQLPQDTNEYMILFRQLAAITDNAMDFISNNPSIQLSSLDRIAQNVETIASLRGDSGIYHGSRTQGLNEYQSEMYRTEDQLRARLLSLGYQYPTPRPLSQTA